MSQRLSSEFRYAHPEPAVAGLGGLRVCPRCNQEFRRETIGQLICRGCRKTKTRPKRLPFHSTELTFREMEIVALVIQGLINRQIAAQLRLETRTVSKYMTNILRKTGMTNRVQLTVWGLENLLNERKD